MSALLKRSKGRSSCSRKAGQRGQGAPARPPGQRQVGVPRAWASPTEARPLQAPIWAAPKMVLTEMKTAGWSFLCWVIFTEHH